jgi:VWFA-related protein
MRNNHAVAFGRRVICAVALAGSVTALMAAQQPARPTFTSAVDLIPIDVSVIDKNGKPVADLTADDFTVTVDGRPRKVSSSQFFSVPQAPPARPTAAAAHFSSNAGVAGGRSIVLAIDAGNIGTARGKATLDAASRFVAKLNPADRVALVTLPAGPAQIDFTSNHALIQAALPKIVGQASAGLATRAFGIGGALAFERSDESVVSQIVERQCSGDASPSNPLGRESCVQQLVNEANQMLTEARARASQSITALQHLFDRLATSDTPKTVVLVSEGMLLSRDYSEVTWIGPRAASAHITLHVMQIDTTDPNAGDRSSSVTRNEDREVLRDGVEAMAGMARGDVLRIVSAPDFAFQRLALELSGYYLLGVDPQAGDRDAKSHKIKVDVRRRDVDVHARREFSVAAASTLSSQDLLLDTLRSPLLAPEIGLKLTTYAFRDPASARIKVILAADVDRASNPEGRYSLAYVVMDDKGKLVANQIEKTIGTPIRPDTKAQTYVGAALVVPGGYTIKLAVVDDGGRRGSVERSVAAKLNAVGSVQVTDLLIADDSAPGATGLTPTVDANFTGDEVHGYLEMYGDAADVFRGATASIEVAENESSKTLAGAPATLDTTETRSVVQGSVPISLLPAGDYVLRAVISFNGREAGHVFRPFHIARPAKTLTETAKPAAPKPSAPVVVASRIAAFDRSTVLSPPVVGYFLDRLAASTPSAAAVRPAVDGARAGRFADVTQALGNAGDDQLAAVFLKGLVLLSNGELNPAANKFRDALRIDSEFLPAVFYLGACYAAGGRDREAAGAWQTALVTETKVPIIYTSLGDALLRLRDIDQAIDVLNEARGQWPNDDEIATRLAAALMMGSRQRDALPVLDGYLTRHPDDTERLFLALRALYEARAAGRPVGSPDEDRAKFIRYADAYAAAKGPQLPLVEQWRKHMDRK